MYTYRSAAFRRLWRLAAVLPALACGGDGSGPDVGEAIDAEAFIATYVDLRVAALVSDDGLVTEENRLEVLSRHAVTEADLVHFAEVHGEDLTFMREVWNEVEQRLEQQRSR